MSGPLLLPTWDLLEATHPQVVTTMRAYLSQVACVLRPGSVTGADLALRSFTTYLAAEHPALQRVRDVDRPQVEGFKTWVAARPGQNKARVTPATIAHRLGTLRVFFTRIDEWGWDDAPPRVPMFLGDVPRQQHALPKALDDPTAAKLLRAAQADRRMLVGVTVEFLLRTGLRVGEYTALASDAVVLIGDTHWLHVPVGKLHEDRYLPLHPTHRDAHRHLPRQARPTRASAAVAQRERASPKTATA